LTGKQFTKAATVIVNKLTPQEFESILKSVVRLENTESIFNNIYKLFHLPIDKKPYTTKTDNTGILTTYKNFEIEIRNFIYVDWDSSEHSRIIFEFKKRKSLLDDFINPTHKIVTDLKKLCTAEIYNAQFDILPTGGFGNESLKVFYQNGTYNPDWEKQHRISPLIIVKTINREKGKDFYIIEFSLNAECYQRKIDKTFLREDWKEIFRYSAPHWL